MAKAWHDLSLKIGKILQSGVVSCAYLSCVTNPNPKLLQSAPHKTLLKTAFLVVPAGLSRRRGNNPCLKDSRLFIQLIHLTAVSSATLIGTGRRNQLRPRNKALNYILTREITRLKLKSCINQGQLQLRLSITPT